MLQLECCHIKKLKKFFIFSFRKPASKTIILYAENVDNYHIFTANSNNVISYFIGITVLVHVTRVPITF